MKFNVKAKGFFDGISPIIEVATKGVMKDFAGAGKVTLTATKSEIKAKSFGGRVAAETDISMLTTDDVEYEHEEDGSATVDAKRLASILESFDPSQMLCLEIKKTADGAGKELVISMKDDAEQFQTCPVLGAAVEMPQQAKKYVKEVAIRRDLFVSAVNRIFFAIGFEEERVEYMYWVLRVSAQHMRYVTGSGGRFAVSDFSGSDIIKIASPVPKGGYVNFMLHKAHTPVMISLMKQSKSDETITLKQSDPKDSAPAQIVIETNTKRLTLVGLNPDQSYIDENMVLSQPYSHKITTKLSDWVWAAKGTMVTNHEGLKKERKAHTADVAADFKKKAIIIKTEESVGKSSRKVPISDFEPKNAGAVDFFCCTAYLNEIATFGDKDDYIQIECFGQQKPVIVRHHAQPQVGDGASCVKEHADGCKESFVVMFCTLNKADPYGNG